MAALQQANPACDLTIAWIFLEGRAREVVKEAVDLDEETWLRARAWAMWKAMYELGEMEDIGSAARVRQRNLVEDLITA